MQNHIHLEKKNWPYLQDGRMYPGKQLFKKDIGNHGVYNRLNMNS